MVDQRLQVGYEGKLFGFGNLISDSPSILRQQGSDRRGGHRDPSLRHHDAFRTWGLADLTKLPSRAPSGERTVPLSSGASVGWARRSGRGMSRLSGQRRRDIRHAPMYLDETQTLIDSPGGEVEAYQWMVDLGHFGYEAAPTVSESEKSCWASKGMACAVSGLCCWLEPDMQPGTRPHSREAYPSHGTFARFRCSGAT